MIQFQHDISADWIISGENFTDMRQKAAIIQNAIEKIDIGLQVEA